MPCSLAPSCNAALVNITVRPLGLKLEDLEEVLEGLRGVPTMFG